MHLSNDYTWFCFVLSEISSFWDSCVEGFWFVISAMPKFDAELNLWSLCCGRSSVLILLTDFICFLMVGTCKFAGSGIVEPWAIEDFSWVQSFWSITTLRNSLESFLDPSWDCWLAWLFCRFGFILLTRIIFRLILMFFDDITLLFYYPAGLLCTALRRDGTLLKFNKPWHSGTSSSSWFWVIWLSWSPWVSACSCRGWLVLSLFGLDCAYSETSWLLFCFCYDTTTLMRLSPNELVSSWEDRL